MKPKILTAILVFSFLMFCSCNSLKGWNIGEMEKSAYPPVIPVTDAVMKITAEKVEPDAENVPVTIENLSDKEYGYGYEPLLELKYRDEWYVVPTLEDIAWIELWVILAPGETNAESFPLAGYYGTLPAGTYRFVKVLNAGGEMLPVAAEFTVN